MFRISVVSVILLVVCVSLPALAQAPTANTISCSSGTACKKGSIPVFASNGGAAKVHDSIIKQSGSTISVAGSETVTTNVSAGGNVAATGNVSGANVTASSNVTGGVISATTSFDISGTPFAFGSSANADALLGFAGNSTMTGQDNTAIGFGALGANTTGGLNVAIGEGALEANTTGNRNTATGQAALAANTTGVDNVADGPAALGDNTDGNNNVAVGIFALQDNTSGSGNTGVGTNALRSNTTGNDLTCIGIDCTASGHKLHNATAIGAHAMVSASNSLVLGSVAGVNGAKATTMVGIGTTSPTNLLTLAQGFGPSIADGWTTYSSRRWKTNIQPLHNALGMVERLQGVSYDLKDSGRHEIGVIAEEVGAVVPEVVSYEENGKDARGVDYSRLTALLIEATKQQQREIRQQQTLLRTQAAAIRDLKSELRTTHQTLQKVQTQVAATQPALVAAK